MKLTLLVYTSALGAVLPFSACSRPESRPSRPNLVFIMADQFRGDAMGCMGKEPVQTPNLDRLASEGILFTDAVSSYPVSSPARAMLMTGMYPAANGVTGNCNSQNTPYGVELSEEAVCWSDVLKEEGYRTAYIGKWHLDAPYRPTWIRTTTKEKWPGTNGVRPNAATGSTSGLLTARTTIT